MHKKILLSAALLFSLAAAQAKPPAELAREKARRAAIERYVESHLNQARYFADTNDDPREGSPRWRELKAKKPGVHPADGLGYYTTARVWKRAGKTALVQVIVSSPSGDWSRGARYFFREDGTLSGIESILNTFYTEDGSSLRVTQDRFFDRSGRLLSQATSFSDAKTGKKLKSASYRKNEAPVFKRLSALPFYALLLKPQR